MKKRPNVLWINLDQLRFDTLGVNGNGLGMTPHMDRLAREGVNFTRCYSSCSLCTPARASMFTGLYAFKNGMGTNHDMFHPLSEDLPHPEMLLHPRLQALGYRTGFVGKWHVGTEKGPVDYGYEGMNVLSYGNCEETRGFQDYIRNNGFTYIKEILMEGWFNSHITPGGVWRGPTESTVPHYLTEYAKDLVDSCLEGGSPFFLTLNYWGPHVVHYPSQEFLGSCDRSRILPWANFNDAHDGKPGRIRRESAGVRENMGDDWKKWRELLGLYYDFTHMIDYEIGRLTDHLKDRGVDGDTLVIITADHGDMAGSHMLVDKGFPYEEAHHIPLIFSWPGMTEDRIESDGLVTNMDVFPTVLDALGIPDETLDGKSFLPLLRGGSSEREDLYLEFHGLRALYSQRTLITKDGWKYIFSPGDFDELYHLPSDPGEMANLAENGEHRDKLTALRERLHKRAVQFGDPLARSMGQFFDYC